MVVPRFSTALSRLRSGIRAAGRRIPSLLVDGIGFVGAGSIAYGAWLIYVPAGFLVGGLEAMLFALMVGRRFAKDAA